MPVEAEGSDANAEKSGARLRLNRLSKKTKILSKKVMSFKSSSTEDGGLGRPGDAAMQQISSEPAFNPKLLRLQNDDKTGLASKTLNTLQSTASSIAHPKDAVKSKVAKSTGRLIQAERPYLSQEADTELLEAHANLRQTEQATFGSVQDREEAAENSRSAVEKLQERRESMKVAYTTSRYVDRVRVVSRRLLCFPSSEDFVERDELGKVIRWQWERWIGYILLYLAQDFSTQYIDNFDELPFDIDHLRHHLERLVMASAPWQTWLLQVRHVYRWEDPALTARWFALYIFLWYTQHLVAFVYGWIIYMVLYNYFFPTTIVSLQDAMDRALDRSKTAAKIGELVDKHGSDDWIGPLVDHLGPWIQVQLGDLASLLEILANFYHWRSPRKTVATLIFFGSCLLVCLLTDMGFCVKIVTFIIGGAFFCCWPVASVYPRYRILVSPLRWVFWDIPTDAEWSFQYLRRAAQEKRELMVTQRVEEREETLIDGDAKKVTAGLSNDDKAWSAASGEHILEQAKVISVQGHWNGSEGRLIISSDGVRFERRLPQGEVWRRSYTEMKEMRKVKGSVLAKMTGYRSKLELIFIDGEVTTVGLKDRDEAFNTIIGFSGLRWQILQRNRGEASQPMEVSTDESSRLTQDRGQGTSTAS